MRIKNVEKKTRNLIEYEQNRNYFSNDFLNRICEELESENMTTFPYKGFDDYFQSFYYISPLSGKLNVNFLPESIKKHLHSVNMLCDEKFLSNNITDFKQMFDCGIENMGDYFSLYSFFNLNITDAKDLKYISNSLGLDLGDNFYRQKKLCGKNRVAYRNYDQLILDSGIVSMDLHNTFFNLEPVLDVNYIDKKLLTVILSCPDFSINNPASKASVICSERNNKKITSERLRQILRVNEDALVLGLIGAKTYFYEISMSKSDMNCSAIICCENNFYEKKSKLSFRIVEVKNEKK